MKRIISYRRALNVMRRFKGAKVLVVGDLIMDHFIWGNVKRISPEAPVPVVDVTRETLLLGGSANVVNNIQSLGGRCYVTGVVGADRDGEALTKELKAKGVETAGIIVDKGRPTTMKTRVIAHSQQVVRFDRESKVKIKAPVSRRVLDYIDKAIKRVDVVIISDYAKGIITEELAQGVIGRVRELGKVVAVDPKVEHLDYYRGATIATPNNLEASQGSGIEITDEGTLARAGEVLLKRLGGEALLITRGEHGMSLFEESPSGSGKGGRKGSGRRVGRGAQPGASTEVHIPTVAREVYDVSGAGDTVIGTMALSLAAGATYREASVLANFAAGVVVGMLGTAAIGAGDLKAALKGALA